MKLRFENLAFRQRICEKRGEFVDLRFKKLAFGQRICKRCGEFGDLRFKNLAFRQTICKRTKKMLRKLPQLCLFGQRLG